MACSKRVPGWILEWRIACIALVAMLAVRGAHAQQYEEGLASIYSFNDVIADVRASTAHVPPEALVKAYGEYVEEWTKHEAELRQGLSKAVGEDFRVYQSGEALERGIRVVRRSRSIAASAEERFIAALIAAVPDSAAQLERVRAWRGTLRSVPQTIGVEGMDVGIVLRRLRVAPDELATAIEILAPSEETRAKRLAKMQRDYEDAIIARGKRAEELGAVGETDQTWNEAHSGRWITRELPLAAPDSRVTAEMMASQRDALHALMPRVSPGVRRSLIDAVMQAMLGPTQGPLIGLREFGGRSPQSPANIARMLLSLEALAPDRHDATRAACAAWLGEDDAVSLRVLDERIEALRNGAPVWTHHNDSAGSSERWKVTERHLPLVMEASGVAWLNKHQYRLPNLDESRLTSSDAIVVGAIRRQIYFASDSPARLRLDGFPVPIEPETRAVIVRALGASQEEQPVVETLLDDHARAWKDSIDPIIAEIRQMNADDGRMAQTAEEIAAARKGAELVDAARRRAFSEADRVDHALFVALESALGDRVRPTTRRLEASRRMSRIAAGCAHDRDAWMLWAEPDRLGGSPWDLASWVDEVGIANDARAAVEKASVDRWAELDALLSQTLAARLDGWLKTALYLVIGSPSAADRDAMMETQFHRMGALVDMWRAVDDSFTPAMESVALAAGASNDDVRFAVDVRRWRGAMSIARSIRDLRSAVRDANAFDAQGPLLDGLAQVERSTLALAYMAVDASKTRVRMGTVPPHELMFQLNAQGFRLQSLFGAGVQLAQAARWLIAQRMPAELIDQNEYLLRETFMVRD